MTPESAVPLVLEDGRRRGPAVFPAAGRRCAVPAWTETGGLEALDAALDRALGPAGSPASTLCLEVEPESVLACARALQRRAFEGLVLVPAPVAGSATELAALSAVPTAAGSAVCVALRLATSVGLRKAQVLRNCGILREVDHVLVTVPLPGRRGLDAAAHFKDEFDALLATVTELLGVLWALGLETGELAVESEPGEDYFASLLLGTPAGVSPRVELRIERADERRGPAERAVLRGGAGAMAWQRKGDVEQLDVKYQGRHTQERLASRPVADTLRRDHLGAFERAALAPWDVRAHGPLFSQAAALVDQYLYGNTERLRQARGARLAEQYAGPGTFFEGFAVSAEAGFEVMFLADLEQSRRFARPVERPARVLLLRAPVLDERSRDVLFPSLALAQLAGAVGSVGATVQCVDLALTLQRRLARGESQEGCVGELLAELSSKLAYPSYDLVGIAVEEAGSLDLTLELLEGGVRELTPHVVLGGRGTSACEYQLRGSKQVDSVISGEGELGLLRLLEHVARGASEDTVPGLWKTSWELHRRVPPVLPDFDFHPSPRFEGIDLQAYRSGKPDIDAPFLPYLFALGCPYKCAFCANNSGHKGRYRSPERTVEELAYLVRTYGVRSFYFLNNLINNEPRSFERFLVSMDRQALGVTWADCARPYGIDAAQMARLRRAGCVELTFGIDTGSQRLSNLMRKGYKLEKAIETVERAYDAGIHPVINLLVGLPHETDEDFAQTVHFVETVRPLVRAFSLSAYEYTIGSPVHDTPAKFGLRRKGDTFDTLAGASWREHRVVRRRRYEELSAMLFERQRAMYMPGFRGYDPGETAAPTTSPSPRLPVQR